MTHPAFLADLAALRLDRVFNPYADRCPEHDVPSSQRHRLENLEAVLEVAWRTKGGSIWVARDLGYRGGRRTGLPLTDEVHLGALSEAWGGLTLRKATGSPVVAERTAAVIWAMLARVKQPVFLWNLFPLHPHGENDPMSNRAHTAGERRIGEAFLGRLLAALQPARVIAIGNDSAAALRSMEVTCLKVRHPSYGGQTDFCDGIAAAYGLPEQGPPPQTCLFQGVA